MVDKLDLPILFYQLTGRKTGGLCFKENISTLWIRYRSKAPFTFSVSMVMVMSFHYENHMFDANLWSKRLSKIQWQYHFHGTKKNLKYKNKNQHTDIVAYKDKKLSIKVSVRNKSNAVNDSLLLFLYFIILPNYLEYVRAFHWF